MLPADTQSSDTRRRGAEGPSGANGPPVEDPGVSAGRVADPGPVIERFDAGADLVREIASDATFSAQVLRLANSALFGFRAQIDTVQHAVVALGLTRIQSLVMTVATSNYMRATFSTEALAKCWRHSLAVAFLSEELARRSGLPADRAYTLGLLHDIGRLGLLVGYPEEYQELLAEADRDSVSLLDLEKRRFGLDHCEAGRILTEEWGLPEEFCVITGRHHDPPQDPDFDLLRVVHLSCRLAESLGYCAVTPLQPMAFEEFLGMLPDAVREHVPATAEEFTGFLERALGESNDDAVSALAGESLGEGRHAIGEVQPEAEREAGTAELPFLSTGIVQTAWDYAVVLVTVAIFVAVMVVCAWLQES